MRILTIILFIFAFQNSWGHGDEDHSKKEASLKSQHESIEKSISNKGNQEVLRIINTEYINTVKPIFKRSCFDCHSSKTTYPWYYKIPGVKQLIDSDVREAKSHLDFSKDFPFISHDTPKNDLKSISKSILDEKMPPKNYLWLHSDAKLNKEEIEEINKWARNSLEALK